MADPKQDPKPMTAAQAANLVFRPATEPDGKPIPITAKEVLDFREYDDRVVVVTVDGQKFVADKAAQ